MFPDLPFLAFSRKRKKNHQKSKDFPSLPKLQIPGKEVKNTPKTKEFLESKKRQGNPTKQGKEDQGCALGSLIFRDELFGDSSAFRPLPHTHLLPAEATRIHPSNQRECLECFPNVRGRFGEYSPEKCFCRALSFCGSNYSLSPDMIPQKFRK